MSNLARLEEFGTAWVERLNSNADVTFEYASREGGYAAPQTVADEFVARHGFAKIGFNWEMLDASVEAQGARAATSVLAEALENDLVMPSFAWLGREQSEACANQFVDAFRPLQRTILSNRFDGIWNPISMATLEYAFVGFDDRKIALLLVTAED